MARRKNRAEILADIEDLKKQLAESEEREERRIGKLANKASLLDLAISDESMQTCGGITPLLLLPCGHHSRAGSPDSVDERRPRACHSARLCVRPGRAARSLCSSASAAPCSGAWPRSH